MDCGMLGQLAPFVVASAGRLRLRDDSDAGGCLQSRG